MWGKYNHISDSGRAGSSKIWKTNISFSVWKPDLGKKGLETHILVYWL